MPSSKLLLRVSPATLLLFLCLQLGINEAQEDTPARKVLIFDVDMPQRAKADEEVTLKLALKTELNECMVVKAYLISNRKISGSFNYKYTRCLCKDSPLTFYWDFETNRTTTIGIVVDITKDTGICPDDLAVTPNTANRYHTIRTLQIDQ